MPGRGKARFNWDALGQAALPRRGPREAAELLLGLAGEHDFIFYKYQLADLVSHTGRVDLAREVFAVIEDFVEAVLRGIDPRETGLRRAGRAIPRAGRRIARSGPTFPAVGCCTRRPRRLYHWECEPASPRGNPPCLVPHSSPPW